MDKLEQFRIALRSGQLNQAFVIALSQGTELDVTSWISRREHRHSPPSSGVKSHFHFNLLANKIETEMGEEFLNHPHSQTLQQFQQQQIAQANATLQANLHCLEQLHQAFAKFELFSAVPPFPTLPESTSEPLEPEDNMLDDLLDSLDAEPEEEWGGETEQGRENETEADIATRTPQVLTIEDFDVTEAEEAEGDAPPPETSTDWQPEATEVDVMPNFESGKQQVSWRPLENQEYDPGTDADWDELDHELDLDSPEDNP